MELELVDNDKLDFGTEKASDNDKPEYKGPERRVCQRRSGHDRRAMVRFELDKADRRQVEDRRHVANIWDKGHTLF